MPNETQARSMAEAFASESKQKLDSIYQIFQEEVALPSGGLLYESKTEKVTIKPITAREEDFLTNPTLIKSGKAFDMLIDKCVINWNGLTHQDLLAGDKTAIYMAIRILSYGPKYKVDVMCPSCNEINNLNLDLRSFGAKSFGNAPKTEGKNVFLFETEAGYEIEFKLLKAIDLDNINNLGKKKKRRNTSYIEDVLLAAIISLKANNITIVDRLELKTIISRMPHSEYAPFLSYIEKIKPDIDMNKELECEHCSEIIKTNVPITAEFFWPATDR